MFVLVNLPCLHVFHIYNHSTAVPRSYDDALSKWCAVQRSRCKAFKKGGPDVPMTQVQYQALVNIGFDMDRARKHYDRAQLDQKWEAK